jgi:hypothetical protein
MKGMYEKTINGRLVRIEKGSFNKKVYWYLFIDNTPVTTTNLKKQAIEKAIEIVGGEW